MAMSELGAFLQRHRTERGFTLDEVEGLTRIRRVYVEAIEAGEWDALPPGVYTRGLLRNYARALGVSQASVMRMYVKERPNEARLPEPQLISRPLVNEPRISLDWVMAVVIGVVAVGIFAYIVREVALPMIQQAGVETPAAGTTAPAGDTGTPPAVGAGPTGSAAAARATEPTPTGASPAGSPGADTPGAGTAGPPAPGPGTPGVIVTSSASAATPTGATPTGATPTGAASTGTAATSAATATRLSGTPAAPLATATGAATSAAAPAGDLAVEVRANGNTWLRIVVDGEVAFENFLRQGDAWKGQAKERVRIRMGNAGDTQITLNGSRVAPLGKRGEVLTREWRLLPDGNIEQIDAPE